MRVCILGAGPAGLYSAYLLKRSRPEAEIELFEQNPPDATFGFGVVFSDRALEFLNEDDPLTRAAIAPHLETWQDITLVQGGERIVIDGIGFAAIGRLKLLQLLQERVASVGVRPHWRRSVKDLAELGDCDLVIAADGVNSLARRAHAEAFGTSISELSNRFAWFGTTKRFETLTQTFRSTAIGCFNAHHYRYSPQMSTFIVEVDAATFARAGLERMDEAEGKALCEEVFAEALEGEKLISNKSHWRRFPKLSNERWSVGNIVLVGDALRTAHFSIGSGTRLAMEDAIALVRALDAHGGDIRAGLFAYEAARRPIVDKLVAAANRSADWYEEFASRLGLAPIDFAMSYITRSGRVDLERLRQVSPGFVDRYCSERPLAANA
ncbi:2-polyprenyl-6-methoxyphenol hydroxylase [Rhizobiales bacterium GAS113]|nr:2-polyprenyl-6-methoxyphenol hydroxylase [Rhizobiales bacterium GAS113]